ncbi:MAG: NAD(P)H-dependent oxidoreductase subunit E [Pseudomonadota bacterium]
MKQIQKIVEQVIKEKGFNYSATIPILQGVQKELRYLPLEALEQIAKKCEIPAAQLYGVATFYTQFRLSPIGRHLIKVCHGTACHVAGALGVSESLGDRLKTDYDGGTTNDNEFTIESVACLGCCSLAPVIMIDETVYGNLDRTKASKTVDDFTASQGQQQDLLEGITIDKKDLAGQEIAQVIIGLGSCGIASGGKVVFDFFSAAKKKFDLPYQLMETGCIGMCHCEPLVEFIDRSGKKTIYRNIQLKDAKKLLQDHLAQGKPFEKRIVDLKTEGSEEYAFYAKQVRIVLENCGQLDPESIDEYIAKGGYAAIKKVREQMKPEQVIAEVKTSGLRGRGGAGFSTGLKWEFCHKAQGTEKYIVCNADEGDPGAFMDRSVLESDPHRVLEGMMIGAYAIGAKKGYIYCRAEYPLAVKRLEIAIAQAKAKCFLGKDLDIIIKEGAGAFVCGEETALIASIEGKRGMPKLRPPFPAQSGLWGKPTNINNVETFANIAWIINHGAQEYAKLGTEKSKGTKVFALAGDIKRGGLVEVPMGITLMEVIRDIGGGTSSGLPVKAVQLGGPSGGCIPASLMGTIVDYDAVNATGAIMGSGGMVVMDTSACMVDIAKFFLNFTQNESCGKCTFCRIGTRRMLEILTRITEGEGRNGDIELLEELAQQIKISSLCGLGQTAPNPVLTTIRYFRDEYEAHIKEGKCPAGKCRALISFDISKKCIGCGVCIKACPVDAITGEKKKLHVISQEKCTRCGACKQVCPVDAVEIK